MTLRDGAYRVSLGGVIQWYRVAGSEQNTTPLMVIHGGPGGNHYVFERTLGSQLEHFTTLIYHEQRGSGRSDAPKSSDYYRMELLVEDVEALRKHLGCERISLLGYSFGGHLALEYALAYPACVENLILQAPAILNDPRLIQTQLQGFLEVAKGDISKRIKVILGQNLRPEQQLEQIWKIADTDTVDRFLFHQSDAAAFNRQLWRESNLINTGEVEAALSRQKPKNILDCLPEIKAPTLVLVGRYDRNVGVDLCLDLARQLANSQHVVFESSAHFPDIEETELYAKRVKVFLDV